MIKKVLIFLTIFMSLFLSLKASCEQDLKSESCASLTYEDGKVTITGSFKNKEGFDNIEYIILFSDLIEELEMNYLDVSVSLESDFEMSSMFIDEFLSCIYYDYVQDGIVFMVIESNNIDDCYNYSVTYLVDKEYEDIINVTEYIRLIEYHDKSNEQVLKTRANILCDINENYGKVEGKIKFSENYYEEGWYELDLHTLKLAYKIDEDIDEVIISANNEFLDERLNETIRINDEESISFYLPSLDVSTSSIIIEYEIVFISIESEGYEDASNLIKTIKYDSIIDVLSPVFSEETYIYVTSVETPLTIEEIMHNISLTAYDDNDGDITNRILYVDISNYKAKVLDQDLSDRIIGNYLIEFSVEDSSGNSASMNLTILVKDTIKPTIDEESLLFYSRSYKDNMITDDTFIEGIIAYDNYSSVNITVDSSTYQENYNTVGEYSVEVIVKDSTENIERATINVLVYDDVAPVFSGNNSFIKSYNINVSIEELLEHLNIKVIDEVDGICCYSIVSDNYTSNMNNVGNYSITLRSYDEALNSSDFVINIMIKDEISPFFLLDKATLVVENGANYTQEQILEFFTQSGVIEEGYKYIEVIEDSYSENMEDEGVYAYRLKVVYEKEEELIDLSIKVIGNKRGKIKVKWYKKMFTDIKIFFSNVFNKIASFFKDVVYDKVIEPIKNFFKSIFK